MKPPAPEPVPIRTFTHCVQCGEKIEPGLVECGSLTCHDCRKPQTIVRAA